MKILLSAYFCHPNRGSEAAVGWNWLREMAKLNETWVFFYTGQGQADAVRGGVADLPYAKNIHLVPIAVPRFFANRLYRVRYELWHREAFRIAQRLLQKEQIDLIHHVTIAAWWNCGYLWQLGVPFIFGPISGAQRPPRAAYRFLPHKDQIAERWRALLFDVAWRIWRRPQDAMRRADLVIAANPETEQKIREIRKDAPVINLSAVGIERVIPKGTTEALHNPDGVTRLVYVGRLIPTKNLAFLIEILHTIPSAIGWRLLVAGDGPLRGQLTQKTRALGLERRVDYLGRLEHSQMAPLYAQADIFVFPSLREGTPTVVLEAMAAQLPVIAFAIHGAQILLDSSCGILIEANNGDRMRTDFREAIIRLCQNPQLRKEMGEAARKRAEARFLWETRGQQMEKLYKQMLEKSGS